MFYFAYGSNLNHFQMKRRCKDSKYLKKINLKNFRLTFRSKYRAADIEPKKNSIVPGGLFEISKSDEKKLDIYEDYPILYKKIYFIYNNKKNKIFYIKLDNPHKYLVFFHRFLIFQIIHLELKSFFLTLYLQLYTCF